MLQGPAAEIRDKISVAVSRFTAVPELPRLFAEMSTRGRLINGHITSRVNIILLLSPSFIRYRTLLSFSIHYNMDHSHMDHSHMDHGNMGHGGHNHGGMDHGDMGSMCSMNMLFTWDTSNLCVVFEGWRVTGVWSLIYTLIAVIALTAGYEAIREASRRYEVSLAKKIEKLHRKYTVVNAALLGMG